MVCTIMGPPDDLIADCGKRWAVPWPQPQPFQIPRLSPANVMIPSTTGYPYQTRWLVPPWLPHRPPIKVLQVRIHKIKGCLGVLHELGDAQLETTLLCSCLALPKLTCPSSHITMRESLEAILGGPIWLKASLPSSRGGVNLRSAAKHAPAAFIASSAKSRGLEEKILQLPDLPPHLDLALAMAASQPNWQQLMCLCDNTICHMPSMNPSTNKCCHLPHLLAPVPWPSRLPCHMLGTG